MTEFYLNNIYLNPTFSCNRNCEYCYAKNLKKFFIDMNLRDFENLLVWLKKQNINFFTFLGGEPTLYPNLVQAIKLMRNYGMICKIDSNGIFNTNLIEDLDFNVSKFFQIHYDNPKFYNKEERDLIDKNLKKLTDRGAFITIRHNIVKPDDSYNHIIDICNKYNIKSLSFSLLGPNSHGTNSYTSFEKLFDYSDSIINLVKDASDSGVKFFHSGLILPLCIFNESDRMFLIKKVDVMGICTSGTGILSINPDLSVHPCPSLEHFKIPNILNFSNINDVYNYYNKIMEKLRWEFLSMDKCRNCHFYKLKKCQGGCLAYKIIKYKKEMIEHQTLPDML